MSNVSTCPLCKGQLTEKIIEYMQDYHGQLCLVENVPAWVCEDCHEVVLEIDVAGRIFDVIRLGKPKGVRSLPVHDLQNVS